MKKAVEADELDRDNSTVQVDPVVQSDHRHAEVEHVGDDGEQRRLLAVVLRR